MRSRERAVLDRLDSLERIGRTYLGVSGSYVLSGSLSSALTSLSGTINARFTSLSSSDNTALSGTVNARFVSLSGTIDARFFSLSGSVDSRITTVSASLLTSPNFSGAITASLAHITSAGSAGTPALKIGSNGVGIYDAGSGLGVLARAGGAYVSWDASSTSFINNLMKQGGGVASVGILSPAQITSDQTDYNPFGGNLYLTREMRVNSDAARTINSLLAGQQGQKLRIWNVGSFAITLLHDDGSTGTAANRFLCPGSTSVVIPANGSADLWYDSTSSRWRVRLSADSVSSSTSVNANRFVQIPGFQGGNAVTTGKSLGSTQNQLYYYGRAPTDWASGSVIGVSYRTISAGSGFTWAELAICTGSFVRGSAPTIWAVGYVSIATKLTGTNTNEYAEIPVMKSTGIRAGEDIWLLWGKLSTGSPTIQASTITDTLVSGMGVNCLMTGTWQPSTFVNTNTFVTVPISAATALHWSLLHYP